MEKRIEKVIYMKAAKSYDSLKKSLEAFEAILEGGETSKASDYYYARNLLRDGKAFFQETLKESKKFLGPIPEYTSDEFVKWRTELLEKDSVLAKSQDFKDLRSEVLDDEFLSKWPNPEEIEASLEKKFSEQQKGKRKLANIKVRVIIDKLQDFISKVQEIQKEALKKQQENI